MSFVYAKKIGYSIAVFADTKITFTKPNINFFNRETQNQIKQFGMIKNIIINSNLCISYTGNDIIYVNKLLQKISNVTIEEILQFALEINLKYKNDGAEFIVCYANHNKQHIFQIKDGKCQDVLVSWIGSYNAFKYFQGICNHNLMSKVKSNIPNYGETSFGTAPCTEEGMEYQRLFDAFHRTINDSGDILVGGFTIPILFEAKKNQFLYKGYIKSYDKMEQTSSGFKLPIYQDAKNGAFSVIFYESSKFVGIFIPQGSLGIIYDNYRVVPSDYINAEMSSFLTPSITKISQLDFYVQTGAKGMKPPGFLGFRPDVIDNYLQRVWFYKNNSELAILYIDKAIEIITIQHRDEWRLDELVSIRRNIQSGLSK